jgi:YNFM family putative membrane transporter
LAPHSVEDLTPFIVEDHTSTPILGHLSDRFGRKVVLIPGLLTLGVLTVLMAWYGHRGGFLPLLLLMGVFLYSDQPILTAAALDVVGRRVTTTAIGVVSFSRLALSAPSPVIAGWLYRPGAPQPVFYYMATIFVISAWVLWLIPLRPPSRTT